MKKADLSLNTIVVAAIVLVVLIVLWAIFTGRMGVFTKGLAEAEQNCKDQCIATGYKDGTLSDNACGTDQTKLRTIRAEGKDKNCCCTGPA